MKLAGIWKENRHIDHIKYLNSKVIMNENGSLRKKIYLRRNNKGFHTHLYTGGDRKDIYGVVISSNCNGLDAA
jgi:hypothetical protein